MNETTSIVTAELQSGEKLLWVGKPMPLRIILQDRRVAIIGLITLIVLVALGVLILVFPNSHLLGLHLVGIGLSFGIAIIAFLLLGLTYFARPIYDYFMARRTIYAVTDRRILILKATFRGRVAQSYRQVDQVKRRSLIRGKSDVIFGSETYRVRHNAQMETRTRKIGFFGIENAREVEQLLNQTFVRQPVSK